MEIIKNNILIGVGLDNFVVHYPTSAFTGKRDKEVSLNFVQPKAHNDYLQIVAELGMPGLLAILWTMAILVRMVQRLFRSNLSDENRDTAFACLAAVLGLSINSVFSFPMYVALPPFILSIYGATVFRLIDPESNEKFWTITHKKFVLIGITLTIGFLVTWLYWQYRFFRAESSFEIQGLALRDGYLKESIYWGNKVEKFNPFRKDVQHLQGRALAEINKRRRAIDYMEEFHKVYPYATYNLYYLAFITWPFVTKS